MPFTKVVGGGDDANQAWISDTPERSVMIFKNIDK